MSETTKETTSPAPTSTPPVRPENPNVTTLKAAFPDVDASVISAVLIASSNNLEKAFDGLLGMSDPNFTPDMPAPAPAPVTAPTTEAERQILADEQFARQLAAQSRYREPREHRTRYAQQDRQQEPEERSFLDDDLPVLKENLIQGFNETKLKVGSFISNLRSQVQARMDGGDEDRHGQYQTQHADTYHAPPRASTQYDRDARTLDDDFGELQLQDNSGDTDGISIPKSSKARESSELARSVGIGPSKATPNTSRWQPIQESSSSATATAAAGTKKEKDSFALGDDDDE